MLKFKVGDIVRVHQHSECPNCEDRILTIISVSKDGFASIFPYRCSVEGGDEEIFEDKHLYLVSKKITNWKEVIHNAKV